MGLILAMLLCICSSAVEYMQTFNALAMKLEGGLTTHLYSGDISKVLDQQYGVDASLGLGFYNTIFSPGISLVFGSTGNDVIYRNQPLPRNSSIITTRPHLGLMHCINFNNFTLMPLVGIGANSLQIAQDSDPSTENYRQEFSDFTYGCEIIFRYADIYDGSKFISVKFERAIILDHSNPGSRTSFAIEMGILGWMRSK